MFCPNCKALMRPKGGKMACPKCGEAQAQEESKSVVVKTAARDKEMTVLEGKGREGLPTAKEECPECAHMEAYYYERQTRAADEATTRFYICAECDHRWRDYQ